MSGDGGAPGPTLWVADLHAEWLLDGAPGSLPRRLLERLAAAGSLLRVLARPDDVLWLPAALDPSCLAEVPGLCRPRLEHGPPPAAVPGRPVRWWMAAPLGRLGDPDAVELSRRLSHRRAGLGLARDLGQALPGACWVRDGEELARAVAAAVGPGGGWVLKPARSAAGRGQLRGRRGDDLARAAAALARVDGMAYEPWLERVEDLGSAAEVGADGSLRLVGRHRLLVTPEGAFRGVRLGVDLSAEDRELLEGTTRAAGERLAAAGYRGPFGLDACRHRGPDGRVRLHPWVELNVRWTFGRLAAELLAAVGSPGRGALHLGRGDQRPGPSAPGEEVLELLRPDPAHEGGGTRAWLSLPLGG